MRRESNPARKGPGVFFPIKLLSGPMDLGTHIQARPEAMGDVPGETVSYLSRGLSCNTVNYTKWIHQAVGSKTLGLR
ncbi:MAG: hypothetical protein CM1200mP14_28980 [Gammaproteobacteria bacterium]|nr:MAG: hypothetical protein CM1200mP14_28980 [Gammaproteobacteria bacterium]